jgi:hypothetical protein
MKFGFGESLCGSKSRFCLACVVLLFCLWLVPISPFGYRSLADVAAADKDSQEQSLIVVGANVEVSRADDSDTHDEVLIASHPTDPAKLVACSMANQNLMAERKMHTVVYTSNDGGKRWDMGPQIPESGDPICEFGPDGAAYFGAIGDSPSLDPAIDWHLKVYRLANDGKTWEQRSEFVAGDRPWLAFDNTNGPNRGWMYITYQSRAGVLDTQEKQLAVSLDLTRSTDGGSTWGLPRAYGIINARRLAHSLPTDMAVLSDGTVAISNWQNLKKSATESEDRIASSFPGDPGLPTCEISLVVIPPDGWKRPKTFKVADKYCSEGPTTRTVDSLAVDTHSESFKDRLYLAWTDARSGHARIMFTHSTDKGETWAKPRVVDDVPGNLSFTPDNYMPTLAVNKAGVVGLSWNDRRENPDNIGYVTRFAASLDGGESWLPSVRVAERSTQFRQGGEGETLSAYAAGDPGQPTIRIARAGEFHAGDTAGLRADADGVFHALWIDNRSGRSEVYTAPITVRGSAMRFGTANLSDLADISSQVAFDVRDVQYDTKKQAVVLQGSLRNKSKETLQGRLVLRVLSLSSEAGIAKITNAENSVSGPGATFDFSGLVPEGGLKPNAATEPKGINFQLSEVHLPPVDGKDLVKVLGLAFVTLDAEILGKPAEKNPSQGKDDKKPD